MATSRLEGWCAEMELTARRRIALNNLKYDMRLRRLSRDLLRDFLTELEMLWASTPEGASPERLITEIADRNASKYLCKGKGLSKPIKCSRVVDDQSFWKNNIDHARAGAYYADEVPDWVIEEIETGGLPSELPNGEMRGRRAFAWVTPSGQLDELRIATEKDALAALVRDNLGLRHYNDDQKLLEISYPDSFLRDERLVPPTFIEGSPDLVYRSKRKRDGWGRTVNLRDGREGFPEAVHTPVTFSSDFTIRGLGRINGKDEHLQWEALAAACPSPWSHSDIATLETLLGYAGS